MERTDEIYENSTSYSYFDDNSLKFSDFEIIQLAKAQFKKDKQKKYFFNQQKHNNACDEITIVATGQGMVENNDNSFSITQGQIHIVFEAQKHRISSNSLTPLTFYCLAFKIPKNSSLYPLYNHVKEYCIENNEYITIDSNKIINAFETLLFRFFSINNKFEYFKQAIEITVKYILTMTLLDFVSDSGNSATVLIEQIKTFLIFNSNNPAALKLLPKHLNYSYTYLSHVFKKECEQTIFDYFKSLRMNHAKDLLLLGVSVSNISDELGYSSIHAFSRAFKQYFGFSPSTNQKRIFSELLR